MPMKARIIIIRPNTRIDFLVLRPGIRFVAIPPE
jgi:hypothetical protein